MMKIAQICTNAMSGSVGKIARDISNTLLSRGHECVICYARGKNYANDHAYRFESALSVYSHIIKARLFDSDGLHSKKATKDLISFLEKYKPDIVHLHCLHGYYINYPMLFEYLKKNQIKIVWTMHDCWAFTGHCSYFDTVRCSKWQKECRNCEQKKEYPRSIWMDRSQKNFIIKKRIFTSLDASNVEIVTPSYWLKELIQKSFLSKYSVQVINNDVDYNFFFIDSNIAIENRVLGVANIWDDRKGLPDFIALSKLLPSNFEILIVGASDRQIKMLNQYGIKAIKRTSNITELANLYRSSAILFNPTYQDNYPTVNVEAIACGLPVVTYRTGGSPEIIEKTSWGKVVEKNDYTSIIDYLKIATSRDLKNCPLLQNQMIDNYLILYKQMIE